MKSAVGSLMSLVSALAFFTVITPAGVLMRAAGSDPLRLRAQRASAFVDTGGRFSRADFETLR